MLIFFFETLYSTLLNDLKEYLENYFGDERLVIDMALF